MDENKDLENLDKIINKLNDQLGIMGNNLIEKQFELDYLKQVNDKLYQINKGLIDQLNKPKQNEMNDLINELINFKN